MNAASEQVQSFCERHGIRKIELSLMTGVTASHRVCNLEFEFAANAQHGEYHANFKLQGDDAHIGHLISGIHADGQIDLNVADANQGDLDHRLTAFFQRIEKRVGKLRQEQSVQSVRFLGNSFLLNGTTTFTVVSDDEGRLGIEIHKGEQRQSAHLLASSLLDGLYDGSISLLTG